MNRPALVFVFAGVLLGGCLSSNQLVNHMRTESGYCDPPVQYDYPRSTEPLSDISPFRDSAILRSFSDRTIAVANACGILPALHQLSIEPTQSVDYFRTRQQIMMRLLLVSSEIASTAAELDCESERARQVADFLINKQNQRVKSLTIFSITVGALSGVVSAAVRSHATGESVAITGGIASAGLGLSALLADKRILFNHPRNLLTDLWEEEKTSAVYPPAVWYMLSEKYFSNAQIYTVSRNMKQRWIKFEGLEGDEKKENTKKLFFGSGGRYSADELRARVRMLNQVQAAVKLMNQDLQGLMLELSKE